MNRTTGTNIPTLRSGPFNSPESPKEQEQVARTDAVVLKVLFRCALLPEYAATASRTSLDLAWIRVVGLFFVYDECGMVCEERMRLLDAYRVATSALFTAATTFQLKAGPEFRTAFMAAEEARAKCVKARLALWDHKTRCEACQSVAASKHARFR